MKINLLSVAIVISVVLSLFKLNGYDISWGMVLLPISIICFIGSLAGGYILYMLKYHPELVRFTRKDTK